MYDEDAVAEFYDRLRAAWWWGFGSAAIPCSIVIALLVVL